MSKTCVARNFPLVPRTDCRPLCSPPPSPLPPSPSPTVADPACEAASSDAAAGVDACELPPVPSPAAPMTRHVPCEPHTSVTQARHSTMSCLSASLSHARPSSGRGCLLLYPLLDPLHAALYDSPPYATATAQSRRSCEPHCAPIVQPKTLRPCRIPDTHTHIHTQAQIDAKAVPRRHAAGAHSSMTRQQHEECKQREERGDACLSLATAVAQPQANSARPSASDTPCRKRRGCLRLECFERVWVGLDQARPGVCNLRSWLAMTPRANDTAHTRYAYTRTSHA